MNYLSVRPLVALCVSFVLIGASCGASENQTTEAQTTHNQDTGNQDTGIDDTADQDTIDPQPPSSERIDATLVVAHVDNRTQELGPAIHIGAQGIDNLRQLLLSLDPATDVSLFDEANPDEYVYVTDGYYCRSGDIYLEATRGQLELITGGGAACDEPQPAASVFQIPRSELDDSFDVLHRAEWDSLGTVVFRVEDWEVVS